MNPLIILIMSTILVALLLSLIAGFLDPGNVPLTGIIWLHGCAVVVAWLRYRRRRP